MKQLKLLFLGLVGLLLVACASSNNLEWLEGDWKSSDWNVTYDIEEEDGLWSITNGAEILATQAKQTIDSDGAIVLTAEDGTQFVIEKVSNTQINFQQVAAEGLLGTTASVTFDKVDE